MRESRLRRVWREGSPALNCWLISPSPIQAERLVALGFDSFVVDMQHGEFDYHDLVGIFMAIAKSDATPMARVPWNEPGAIMRVLDAGALGVICPMVNTRAEAEAFVGACRYPPDGYRSSAPMRGHLHAGMEFRDYVGWVNEQVVTIALIETRTAMENLDDILQTPGLDAVYVGSSDLSLSYGGPVGVDHADPRTTECHVQIAAATARHGVRLGLHTVDDEDVAICLGHGADLISVADPTELLTKAAERRLLAARTALSESEPTSQASSSLAKHAR